MVHQQFQLRGTLKTQQQKGSDCVELSGTYHGKGGLCIPVQLQASGAFPTPGPDARHVGSSRTSILFCFTGTLSPKHTPKCAEHVSIFFDWKPRSQSWNMRTGVGWNRYGYFELHGNIEVPVATGTCCFKVHKKFTSPAQKPAIGERWNIISCGLLREVVVKFVLQSIDEYHVQYSDTGKEDRIAPGMFWMRITPNSSTVAAAAARPLKQKKQKRVKLLPRTYRKKRTVDQTTVTTTAEFHLNRKKRKYVQQRHSSKRAQKKRWLPNPYIDTTARALCAKINVYLVRMTYQTAKLAVIQTTKEITRLSVLVRSKDVNAIKHCQKQLQLNIESLLKIENCMRPVYNNNRNIMK